VSDAAFLERAAALAAPWMTFPNPRVGCVIVDADGVIVGEGAHHAAGEPHAEANALSMAGGLARGATAYVTLEPHNSFGRTPPCSLALIEAGVARVVIAVAEPNPVAAGGADTLRAAGVAVDFVACPAAEVVNEHWLHSMRAGRPFVTLKLATTLDGRVSAAPGVETSISNAASRRRVHELRARVDAVLVGSGTAVVDDPQLNVREVEAQRQPRRFVMGERELPGHLWMLTAGQAAEQLRTHDPKVALAALHELGIRHLLVEGGPTIARAFLEAGLVDECIWITAPKVFGDGPSAIGAPALDAVMAWQRCDTVDVEGDLWSYLRPV
jgi:diaminohydroxyphosphoribosylaminopyrimidine deaminase/5-amino-6-(5-phosphoribosylamino)uracil reductase